METGNTSFRVLFDMFFVRSPSISLNEGGHSVAAMDIVAARLSGSGGEWVFARQCPHRYLTVFQM